MKHTISKYLQKTSGITTAAMVLPGAACVKAVFFPSLTKQGAWIEGEQYMLLLRLLKLFHIKTHKQPKRTRSVRSRKYCPADKTGWKVYSAVINGSVSEGRIYRRLSPGSIWGYSGFSLIMSNIRRPCSGKGHWHTRWGFRMVLVMWSSRQGCDVAGMANVLLDQLGSFIPNENVTGRQGAVGKEFSPLWNAIVGRRVDFDAREQRMGHGMKYGQRRVRNY